MFAIVTGMNPAGNHNETFGDPDGYVPVGTIPTAELPTAELPTAVLEARLAAQRSRAEYLELLAEANRRRCTRDTIHRSQAIWLADSMRVSKATAGQHLDQALLVFVEFPELGAAYRAGVFADAHLGLFTRLWNRSGFRDGFARDLDLLVGFTQQPWPICRELFAAWETLA